MTKETIELLMILPEGLHLTGSYYFGNNTPDSDVDLFIDAGAHASIEKLKRLGFEYLSGKKYVDKLTFDVLRHESGIDVQIVSNVSLKLRSQEILKSSPLPRVNINKRWWDWASEIAQQMP